jgi:hypothetical protein
MIMMVATWENPCCYYSSSSIEMTPSFNFFCSLKLSFEYSIPGWITPFQLSFLYDFV